MPSLLDTLTVAAAAVLTGRGRFFASGADSVPLSAQLEAITLRMPEAALDSGGGVEAVAAGSSAEPGPPVHEVEADTAVGRLYPAFQVAQWLGSEKPLVVFHHGSNERPFDYGRTAKNTFRRVFFSKGGLFPANLVNLRAPLHRSLKEYKEGIRELSHFAAMLMTSVALIESIVKRARESGVTPVMICGLSLGGWVTNLHRAYVDSADLYAPMLAGAALGDMFCDSAYRRLVGSAGKQRPEAVRDVLNFEEAFAERQAPTVFPLLARHDAIVTFERQRRCYEGRYPIAVIDRGHTTGMLAPLALRRHLQNVLKGEVTL